MVRLVRASIDYAAVTEAVRSHRAGAVVLFLGTARELTDGRRTDSLAYEAYPEMAQRELERLEAEARGRWPLVECGIWHRLGPLELGEISVAVAISTPHRAEAFEAARWIMDQIKQTVPIWKKENWSDGTSQWVHPTAG